VATPIDKRERFPPGEQVKMVMVRMPASLLAEIREVAKRDGLTYSAWMRNLAIKELRKRERR